MSLLPFMKRKETENTGINPQIEAFLDGYSIEVMPHSRKGR